MTIIGHNSTEPRKGSKRIKHNWEFRFRTDLDVEIPKNADPDKGQIIPSGQDVSDRILNIFKDPTCPNS
jgi:hypothetical protein